MRISGFNYPSSGCLNVACIGIGANTKVRFSSAAVTARRCALAASTILIVAGCAHIGTARQAEASGPPAGIPPSREAHPGTGRGADPYLALLERFNAAGAEQREVLYEKATIAAALKPGARHRLELALLKLSAGHSGYNLQAAETLLESVMADAGPLPPAAVSLAASYLRLVREYNSLKSANATLKNRLTEARDKLDALTRIEQAVQPGDDIPHQPLEVTPDER